MFLEGPAFPHPIDNFLRYYAALLPRRGPHIASHSVCPSVPLSSVTSRHLANYNDTLRAAYRTAISAAQTCFVRTWQTLAHTELDHFRCQIFAMQMTSN